MREYTPQELHKADLQYNFNKTDLFLSEKNTGKKFFLFDTQSPLIKKYPNLSFLATDVLKKVINEVEPETLNIIEYNLSLLIGNDDMGVNIKYFTASYYDEPLKTLTKWYIGEKGITNEVLYNFILNINRDIENGNLENYDKLLLEQGL
jgi:hypothetical protein